MKKSDLEDVVEYMYLDEKRDFQEWCLENGYASGDVDLDWDAKAREIGEGHMFCNVIAIKDFLDE